MVECLKQFFQCELAGLEFEEMKKRSRFSFGNCRVSFTLLFEFAPLIACSGFAGIESYGVVSEGDLKQAKGGQKQLIAWKISLNMEKYRQMTFKEKCFLTRGKLGCCRPCERHMCELRPINALLCQGLG